jgi:site-specific DNA recombinase
MSLAGALPRVKASPSRRSSRKTSPELSWHGRCWDQLRSGIKSGAYAAVFCYATDRLSRSPVHLVLIAEECQKCEVALVFVTEPLDSSPEGQLLTFVRGWAAQLEREKIKDRTIRGKASRIASGRLPVT